MNKTHLFFISVIIGLSVFILIDKINTTLIQNENKLSKSDLYYSTALHFIVDDMSSLENVKLYITQTGCFYKLITIESIAREALYLASFLCTNSVDTNLAYNVIIKNIKGAKINIDPFGFTSVRILS